MAKGTCAPIVCLMVNHAVMAGGGESKWEESEGSRKCIKAPCSLWVLPSLAEL